jgi:CheY-like chemotaxis protein
VIRARLDNLDSHAREIVRVASVIGSEFEHALLAEAVPAHVDLGAAIGALEAAGLVQQTTVAGTIGYRFTHALTQEVCYDSLVGHQRKALHEAIGRALASTHPERMDERDALLAHHFSRAEDWPSAIRFGRRAAERAIALSQFGDAMVALDQVIEWARHLPDRQHHVVADLLERADDEFAYTFASDGLEAVRKAEEIRPDVIVMDVALPLLTGIGAARQIRKLIPDAKIVFLSTLSDPELVRAALHAGGRGYVLKADAHGSLLLGLRAVLLGRYFLSSSLSSIEG